MAAAGLVVLRSAAMQQELSNNEVELLLEHAMTLEREKTTEDTVAHVEAHCLAFDVRRGASVHGVARVHSRKIFILGGLLLALGLLVFSIGKIQMRLAQPSVTESSAAKDDVVALAIDRDATPSLFCFSIMQPKGYEPVLIKMQLEKRASIFACNEFAVISPEKVPIGNMSWGEVTTWKNSAPAVPMGQYGMNGQKTDSFLNTGTFLQAWDTLINSGKIWKHDFVVKVDPDAVFFPDRLREHVRPDNGTSVYYTNCAKWGPKALLYGSVEVFSMQALQTYAERVKDCKSLPWQGWGEDYYMQHCMQMLGVREVADVNQVGDHRCIAAGCHDYHKAAYHDFKSPEDWLHCYNTAIGMYDTTTTLPALPVAAADQVVTQPPAGKPAAAKPAPSAAAAAAAAQVAAARGQPSGPATQPPVLQPQG